MMNSLKINNFKIFKEQSLSFGNLNILTGQNGMGKSTVLQVLLLLRESYLDRMLLNRGISLSNNILANVGKISDALSINATSEEIEFDIEIDKQHYCFIFSAKENGKDNTFLQLIQNQNDNSVVSNISLFKEENFVYLKSDRIIPQNAYKIGYEFKNKFKNDGEYTISFLYQHGNYPIAEALCIANIPQTLKAQADAWLSFISPDIKIRTSPQGNNEIHLDYSFRNTTKYFDAINVGFGITFCLPIVIALLSAQADDLIIIENPESHLHPQGQSKLAELMCLAAQNGVQIICETHSDHIINGTLVQCKRFENSGNGINKENVKIYYFERNEEEHASNVKNVEILTGGRIIYPPNNFFDQISKDKKVLMGF